MGKKLKILLINPPAKNPACGSPVEFLMSESGSYPPLGLLQIATQVVRKTSHDVKIIDSQLERLDYTGIRNIIFKEKPDIVGTTLNTEFLCDGYLVLKTAKQISSEIVTVAGGPHVTLFPVQTIKLKEIDYGFCGDADLNFLDFLESISRGKSVDDIPGIISKNNLDRKVSIVAIEDLDSVGFPDRRLLNYTKYSSLIAKDKPVTTLMTSRGCPFNCAFCPAGRTKIRYVSPEKVVGELKDCVELGIRDILFFDELYTYDKKRVFEISNKIISEGLKVRYHIRARIETLDEETINILKKSGCRLIQFGIESGTDRIQKLLRKNLNLDKVKRIIKLTREAGILTYGNFMLGSPTETYDEIMKTIEFAIELKLDFAIFAITKLLPKTDLYKNALKTGLLKTPIWEEYMANPEIKIDSAYSSDQFSKEQLEKICIDAFRKFYLRPKYIVENYFGRIFSLKLFLTHLKSGLKIFLRW